ncbi:MAG: hypothetical protein WCG97_00930 [bacterium]
MKKGFDYLFESTDKLPPEIASVVLEFNFTGGFTSLINKYKLHLDQADDLEDMTFRVMFADMKPADFTAKLVSDFKLAPVTAKELTDDTNTNIIEPVRKSIQDYINTMLEDYKDIEIDESKIEGEDKTTNVAINPSVPSPQEFHPKSLYNESITDEEPKKHNNGTTLTHADILHGIENPHSSLQQIKPAEPFKMENSPIKKVSGSKSYADVMGGGSNKVKWNDANEIEKAIHHAPLSPKTPEVKAEKPSNLPAETPVILPAKTTGAVVPKLTVDPIAQKSSSVVVSSPSTDPYKEVI